MNKSAPHREKFTDSLPFDRKSCRGEIEGDGGADLKPLDAYPQVCRCRVIPSEDYTDIGAKHVIMH